MISPKVTNQIKPTIHAFVTSKDNAGRKLLYNEVIDVVKRHHLSAEVSNRGIDVPSMTYDALSKLKSMGIVVRSPKI